MEKPKTYAEAKDNKMINIETIEKVLPHGSGIDCTWVISEQKNGKIMAKNYFHAMNDGGYYDGYMDFKVIFFKHKETKVNKLSGPSEGCIQIVHEKGEWDFKLLCNENRKRSFNGLKEYLNDTIYESVHEYLKEVNVDCVLTNTIFKPVYNLNKGLI